MSFVSPTAALRHVYQFANQPQNKEAIKNVVGSVTFVFGLYEAWDISRECYDFYNGRISEVPIRAMNWKSKTLKVAGLFARISILLSGATSRPGVALTKWSFSFILNQDQLQSLVGGVATNFVTNHSQLRHQISVIACLMGIPSILKLSADSAYWLKNKIMNVIPNSQPDPYRIHHVMSIWNTLTGRPTLHLVNSLVRNAV